MKEQEVEFFFVSFNNKTKKKKNILLISTRPQRACSPPAPRSPCREQGPGGRLRVEAQGREAGDFLRVALQRRRSWSSCRSSSLGRLLAAAARRRLPPPLLLRKKPRSAPASVLRLLSSKRSAWGISCSDRKGKEAFSVGNRSTPPLPDAGEVDAALEAAEHVEAEEEGHGLLGLLLVVEVVEGREKGWSRRVVGGEKQKGGAAAAAPKMQEEEEKTRRKRRLKKIPTFEKGKKKKSLLTFSLLFIVLTSFSSH